MLKLKLYIFYFCVSWKNWYQKKKNPYKQGYQKCLFFLRLFMSKCNCYRKQKVENLKIHIKNLLNKFSNKNKKSKISLFINFIKFLIIVIKLLYYFFILFR